MSMSIKPCREKWKGSMTSRERFNNQLHYKPVDRCFNMEFGYWNENFGQWSIFIENGITNNDQADIFFNFDTIRFGQSRLLAPQVWLYPAFENKVVEQTSSSKIIMNEDGLLAEVPKDEHDTIPHYIKSSIVTPDDWAKCKAERLVRGNPGRKVDVQAMKKAYPADRDYPVGVYCGSMIGRIRDMLTFEGLAYACSDYPEMVEDMVETACVLTEDYLDQVLPEIDFDFAHGWEDICFKNGPIVSVEFFRDVVMPRYKRIGKKLSQAGIDVCLCDCDGDIRPILPFFLEGGINCMYPYEVNSCCHPVELLNEYGKDLLIMGGVNKMELAKGPEPIKAYLESLVPGVERGGYIPFCDHRCPPNVKVEDYLYYLDLKEEMFGMK